MEKLASVEIELKALEMTQLRVVAQEKYLPRGKPNPMSSVLKIKGSELQQATTELMMDVIGPYVAPFFPEEELEGRNEPSVGPDDAATAAPMYFNWRKISIYGGSNEIQRNILAKAVLGF
jgi:alkylation response protein AidB-like acyl-CoA dehydrogenase